MNTSTLDRDTGYFSTSIRATVVKYKPMDIDTRQSLILVPNSEFLKEQIQNIGYFNQVATYEELGTIIIETGLGNKIPSIMDKTGVKNAARHYKPFIWFRHTERQSASEDFVQFILTDALTLKDILVVETSTGKYLSGANDQYNWYPMFNSIIDYLKENSNTYGRAQNKSPAHVDQNDR
ncbi:MAG: hypothetical protein OEY89_16035 [Gammaproteobacteria bacterium]|nr:hypothetical protein [Gammaproteobacteria bacterium]